MRDDLLPILPGGVQDYLLAFVNPYLRCETLRQCSRTLRDYIDAEVTLDTVRWIHRHTYEHFPEDQQWWLGQPLTLTINLENIAAGSRIASRLTRDFGWTGERWQPPCLIAPITLDALSYWINSNWRTDTHFINSPNYSEVWYFPDGAALHDHLAKWWRIEREDVINDGPLMHDTLRDTLRPSSS